MRSSRPQDESDRINFMLQLADAHNVKAACAVLADHSGYVDALKEAEPWLFSDTSAKQQRGVLDDFSLVNPTRSNRVLERFSHIVEVPQVRFYTVIDLKSGNGTLWASIKTAYTYFRIDTASTPGYVTAA